ncbi:MAG: nucleotidyltransferase family protein [Pseudomonadota bacterium]
MLAALPDKLESALRGNPVVSAVLDGWAELQLPSCWLVAGAVYQSYWNTAFGFAPRHGISDVDVIYFDPDDLSEEAENEHAGRVNSRHANLNMRFDVKNEARVHLWYEDRFGYPIDAYTSAESAMETFPTTMGAIGIRPDGEKLEAYAPFGFDDLLSLTVRPNKRQITRSIYTDKVRRWVSLWPQLKVVDWEDA